jgi:uncharacterized protein
MSDETRLQVTAKADDSSLMVSKVRSGLIARGRRDLVLLISREPTDRLLNVRQLAAEGDADAQYDLGRAYYEGDGVPKDYAEALRWFRKAADQLHLDANSDLGRMYETGEGGSTDRAEAVRYYFRAADIALDYFEKLGRQMLPDGDPRQGWDAELVLDAVGAGAEHGHAEAQDFLGYIHASGGLHWIPQNYAEAARWWRKAAEQGYAEAQFRLGLVAENPTEGAKWYRKAADQGHAEAQFNLAFHYLSSDEPQDHTEAARLWRKAADQGHAEAQYWLGTAYEEGEGVPQDRAEAVRWFRRAAEQGLASAQYNLGLRPPEEV